MSEEPIKPNPSPEQYAALQEELQKLKANNPKLLDQNIKAKEAGKAIPPDVDVNALIAYKQKKEQEELEAQGKYEEAREKLATQYREAEEAKNNMRLLCAGHRKCDLDPAPRRSKEMKKGYAPGYAPYINIQIIYVYIYIFMCI